MARSKHKTAAPLPAGVPTDALFVNETRLTNSMVKEGCRLTTSAVLRIVYFALGIGLGIFAVVWRAFFGADTLAFILVLLVGLMTVWQGSRLPMESARRMIAQLDKVGDSSRDRVFYATEEGLGVKIGDGAARVFPWSAFSRAVATTSVCCLTIGGQSALVVMDMNGFVRGSNAEFVHFVATHVTEPEQNAFVRGCERICRTLDGWSGVQAAQREKDAAKKAARQQKKQERRNRRRR